MQNSAMEFVENVLPALSEYLESSEGAALVTLVGIEGSSPRPLGSQIAVAADGRFAGMITGGCAEKAIVAEAVAAIRKQENKKIRYGAGSPYLDVVLPCGSGIDLYLEAKNVSDFAPRLVERQKRRKTAYLAIDLENMTSFVSTTRGGTSPDVFIKTVEPDYRVFTFGEGANLISFCQIANAAGLTVEAFSPDEDALAYLKDKGVAGHSIHIKSDFASFNTDAFTAVVTLFHEHEWEQEILHAALNTDADYIGALGSRTTHQLRLESLKEKPATKQSTDSIHGPVGLNIGAQNPKEIAISIVAEIIEKRRRKNV